MVTGVTLTDTTGGTAAFEVFETVFETVRFGVGARRWLPEERAEEDKDGDSARVSAAIAAALAERGGAFCFGATGDASAWSAERTP